MQCYQYEHLMFYLLNLTLFVRDHIKDCLWSLATRSSEHGYSWNGCQWQFAYDSIIFHPQVQKSLTVVIRESKAVSMALSPLVLSPPILALRSPTTMSTSCRGVVLISPFNCLYNSSLISSGASSVNFVNVELNLVLINLSICR